MHICALYIPSEPSPYFKDDIFDDISNNINNFENLQTPIMLCGDYNSRTGKSILLHYVSDKGDEHLKNNLKVTAQIVSNRKSSDSEINNHGKKLINTCKENNLRIINGRCLGDSFSQRTFLRQGAKSLTDYTVTSYVFFDKISGLIIKPLTYFSDHYQVVTNISISTDTKEAYRAAFSSNEMKAKSKIF